MENINKVEISGILKGMSLSKPLAVVTSAKGNPFIRFIVDQVNDKGKKNKIVCIAFGHMAELAYQNENKEVVVKGVIEFSSYKDKVTNEWKNSVNVIANSIESPNWQHTYEQKPGKHLDSVEMFDITLPDPPKETPKELPTEKETED